MSDMKFDKSEFDLAMVEIGSAVLRLQRAGLSEGQTLKAVQRLIESECDVTCVSADEMMWDDATPEGGDGSADAVKESDGDNGPDTVKDTEKKPWDKGEPDGDEAPDTVKDPVQTEGFDRFMSDILLAEGRKATRRDTNLPDSPGMLHAKRYGEKAHNRILIKK